MTVATAEDPNASDDPRLYSVKTLGKALTLLDVVAASEHPPTVSELALKAGLTRPTAHRLVQTLVAAGFLQQDPLDNRLTIGFAVLPLASSLLDRNRLRLEALPHVQALAHKMNERVNLGILNRNRVLILAGGEKPSLPTIYSRFGRTVPVHCCALGKAMLAFLPAGEVQDIVKAHPLTARTPNTHTTMSALLSDLEGVRARGYSIENGENSPTSCCVGVPILDSRDRPIAAISVSARSLEPLVKDIGDVLRTAELISHIL
jgi:IclR family acetate operon transcriptional repressor